MFFLRDEEERTRSLVRDAKILAKIFSYLKAREDDVDKWGPLIICGPLPEELGIEEELWDVARELAMDLKFRELNSGPLNFEPSEDEYEDDFTSCSSSSSTTSSLEYGSLRQNISSIAAGPTCLIKSKDPLGRNWENHIRFGAVDVRMFYVSERERTMKREACPKEVRCRLHNKEITDDPWKLIDLSKTEELDELVTKRLKYKQAPVQKGDSSDEDENDVVDQISLQLDISKTEELDQLMAKRLRYKQAPKQKGDSDDDADADNKSQRSKLVDKERGRAYRNKTSGSPDLPKARLPATGKNEKRLPKTPENVMARLSVHVPASLCAQSADIRPTLASKSASTPALSYLQPTQKQHQSTKPKSPRRPENSAAVMKQPSLRVSESVDAFRAHTPRYGAKKSHNGSPFRDPLPVLEETSPRAKSQVETDPTSTTKVPSPDKTKEDEMNSPRPKPPTDEKRNHTKTNHGLVQDYHKQGNSPRGVILVKPAGKLSDEEPDEFSGDEEEGNPGKKDLRKDDDSEPQPFILTPHEPTTKTRLRHWLKRKCVKMYRCMRVFNCIKI